MWTNLRIYQKLCSVKCEFVNNFKTFSSKRNSPPNSKIIWILQMCVCINYVPALFIPVFEIKDVGTQLNVLLFYKWPYRCCGFWTAPSVQEHILFSEDHFICAVIEGEDVCSAFCPFFWLEVSCLNDAIATFILKNHEDVNYCLHFSIALPNLKPYIKTEGINNIVCEWPSCLVWGIQTVLILTAFFFFREW